MIGFFWAALIVAFLCVAIGAMVCVKKLSALTAAADRLGKHPLFAALRTAGASGAAIGSAAQTLSESSQKLGAGLGSIGEALGAVAAYAAFVTAIANSVEDLLETFVPTLRHQTAAEHDS